MLTPRVWANVTLKGHVKETLPMKGMNAVWAMSAALGAALSLAACDRANGDSEDGKAKAAPAAAPPSDAPTPSTGPRPGGEAASAAVEGKGPPYAALPPGASPEGPAAQAADAAGSGGLLTYSTDLAPEAVIDFHRARAEGAGLVTVATMTQGETRSYAASDPRRPDKTVQVVASPVPGAAEPKRTSVQLTWTAGD